MGLKRDLIDLLGQVGKKEKGKGHCRWGQGCERRLKAETRTTYLVGKNRKKVCVIKWEMEREGIMDTFLTIRYRKHQLKLASTSSLRTL